MLVLRRKKHEGVVIGDEVRLTVEEILGSGDGQRIFGATVQLGFQSPPYVSIYRNELCAKSSWAAHSRRKTRPAQPQPGKLVEIADAQVRLRIQVPPQIPVCCNGTPTAGLDSQEGLDGANCTSKVVHLVTCHKEDRVVICNNITIAILNFHRFVSFRDLHEETVSTRFVGVGGS